MTTALIVSVLLNIIQFLIIYKSRRKKKRKVKTPEQAISIFRRDQNLIDNAYKRRL